MAAILKTCGFKVTWSIRHTCVTWLQSDRIREKQAMLGLQNKTLGNPKLPVYRPEEVLYVQERVVLKKKYPGKK